MGLCTGPTGDVAVFLLKLLYSGGHLEVTCLPGLHFLCWTPKQVVHPTGVTGLGTGTLCARLPGLESEQGL